MFRRKNFSGEVLLEDRAAYDSILKTASLKTQAIAQELAWAKSEENQHLATIFGKLAEIQFMHNEAEKQMAEKFQEVNKAFKHIFQEERILEETKREQQNYLSKVAKLQKQLEASRKRVDQSKLQHLEHDVSTQRHLYDQLSKSVEAKGSKLEIYKIEFLKKGLCSQAEGFLTLSGRCQQLYAAQMQLVDLLPNSPLTSTGKEAEKEKDDVNQQMSSVVKKVSDLLDIHPPPSGGLILRKSPSNSPGLNRRSMIEPFLFLGGKKESESPKLDKKLRKRHSSCSTEKFDCSTGRSTPESPLTESPPASVEPLKKSPLLPLHHSGSPLPPHPSDSPLPPHPSDSPLPPLDPSNFLPHQPSPYCEIMIPSVHTKDRPTVAKSKSETSINSVRISDKEDREHNIMSSRFDRRLEEAGLLKLSPESKNTPLSSTEDLHYNPVDPGYAKLTILTYSPNVVRRKKEKLRDVVVDDDYASPADALSFNNNNNRGQQFSNIGYTNTPSPPSSPKRIIPPSVSKGALGRISPYQSVDEIRKMREKQIKESEGRRKTHSVSVIRGKETNRDSKISCFQYDDNPGYSEPFNAASKKKHNRASSDTSSKNQTNPASWQRTSSNERMGKEPSAKFLHKVDSATSLGEKLSPDGGGDGDISPRSSSTGMSPFGSKSGSQNSLDTSSTHVDRFILEVENKSPEMNQPSRADTGRTRSVDSTLYTPAKITKLRNGRDHVSLLAAKNTGKK